MDGPAAGSVDGAVAVGCVFGAVDGGVTEGSAGLVAGCVEGAVAAAVLVVVAGVVAGASSARAADVMHPTTIPSSNALTRIFMIAPAQIPNDTSRPLPRPADSLHRCGRMPTSAHTASGNAGIARLTSSGASVFTTQSASVSFSGG